MDSTPDCQEGAAAAPSQLGTWLDGRGLLFPTLVLLDLLRPFDWLVGQGWLLVRPLVALSGAPLDELSEAIEREEGLEQLTQRLSRVEEGGR